LIEGPQILIFYRWSSEIPGAEQQPAVVARLLADELRIYGWEAWIDKKSLTVGSQDLRDTIISELDKGKIAIISIGVGDLGRCAAADDFFRWEIDAVRNLEKERKLQVAIIVHGTAVPEDLICGKSKDIKKRRQIMRSLGPWGQDILEYLTTHYVIYFNNIDQVEAIVHKVILLVKE